MKKFVSILLAVALMLTGICALAGSPDTDTEEYDPYTEPTATPAKHHAAATTTAPANGTDDEAEDEAEDEDEPQVVLVDAPEGYSEAYVVTVPGQTEKETTVEFWTKGEVKEVKLIIDGVEEDVEFKFVNGKLFIKLTPDQLKRIKAAEKAMFVIK